MIMRIWHGYTKPENADKYEQMLKEEILPGIHRVKGYAGAYLLRRQNGKEVEFITATMWESWAAIQEFAGADQTKSVIHPKAHALLTHCDESSEHFDATWVA